MNVKDMRHIYVVVKEIENEITKIWFAVWCNVYGLELKKNHWCCGRTGRTKSCRQFAKYCNNMEV